ncbi:hypothetical protein [Methanogenium marinum]|nr:hypothetical protein [Methanogenium marinum]
MAACTAGCSRHSANVTPGIGGNFRRQRLRCHTCGRYWPYPSDS